MILPYPEVGIICPCSKCKRSAYFRSDDEFASSIQEGCEHCRGDNYPKYTPVFQPKLNKWRIIEEKFEKYRSWFGRGEKTRIIKTELTMPVDFHYGESPTRYLEFDSLKETKEYIKNLLK